MGTCPLRYARELNIVSDGDDCSIFLMKVYRKRRIGKDKLVGSLTDTFGGVLGKLKDSGRKIICVTCSTEVTSYIKVLEETLARDTSDGAGLSGITIKFALAIKPREDVNADKRQATDAVTTALETVGRLRSTPAVVGLLSTAVDTGTNVVAELQTLQTTWGVLLDRMGRFNNIVGAIAQVFGAVSQFPRGLNTTQIHPYTSLAWSVITAANQVCPLLDIRAIPDHWRYFIQVLVGQKNRDDRIIRLAGTMSDMFAFVDDAEPLKAIKAHIEIITVLIQQVAECGYFITEYVNQKNFCQSSSSVS